MTSGEFCNTGPKGQQFLFNKGHEQLCFSLVKRSNEFLPLLFTLWGFFRPSCLIEIRCHPFFSSTNFQKFSIQIYIPGDAQFFFLESIVEGYPVAVLLGVHEHSVAVEEKSRRQRRSGRGRRRSSRASDDARSPASVCGGGGGGGQPSRSRRANACCSGARTRTGARAGD